MDIPPKNNSYIDCKKNTGWCVYFGWCIIVTLVLIIYGLSNRSNLTDDEYIEELKKLGYNNITEAEIRYNQIQNEITNYINNKVTIDCSNIYGRQAKRNCNSRKNLEISKFKEDYKKNKLNDNERKLISLYEKQNIMSKLIIVGYIGIPLFALLIYIMPWWWWI